MQNDNKMINNDKRYYYLLQKDNILDRFNISMSDNIEVTIPQLYQKNPSL